MKRKLEAASQQKNFYRPDWDTYFMGICHYIKIRSNCIRRQVAAVVVKDNRIISAGYNGTPRGIKNCFEGGCKRCASDAPSGSNLSECICSHAEENAITQAAYYGVSLKDATLYCTESPCLTCAKMIIGAGIKRVCYENEYKFNEQVKALFKEGKVVFRKIKRKNVTK